MNNKDMFHILTHLPVIKDIKCPPAPRASSFTYLWPEIMIYIEIPKDIDKNRNLYKVPKVPFASLKEYSWDIS